MKQAARWFLNAIIIMSSGFITTGSACALSNERETPVVQAVRAVSAAVVNISSEIEIRRRVGPFSHFGMDPFLDSFFRDFFDPGFEQRLKRNSLGSGVIIDGERGLILTNEHVITRASSISVVLQDERNFDARVIGSDPDSDLAVLQIHTQDPLPAVAMGDSEDLMIGETVIAIGNPFGFSHTVTTGVISALDRSVRTENRVFLNFIQTDASINPGNSGGPLLNINGSLIGINTAVYAKAQGIGFAIPISKAKRIVSDLLHYGEVVQGWVGLSVQGLDPKVAGYMNLQAGIGVLVESVFPDSPASEGGVRDGDILLAVGDTRVTSPDDYRAAIREYRAGQNIAMRIYRNGNTFSLSVTIRNFPLHRALALGDALLGIRVADITPRLQRRYQLTTDHGVVVTHCRKGFYLSRIGAAPGDVLRQMNQAPIENLKDFKKAIVKYRRKSSWIILLQRGDRAYYLTVQRS